MKLKLRVLTPGKQEGKEFEIKVPQFLVGRGPECHLRPASTLISKQHCELTQRDGKAFIRDFGSTNGTFVNDEPVQGERELSNLDRLKIGPIALEVQLIEPSPEEENQGAPEFNPSRDSGEMAALLLAPDDPTASPSTSEEPAEGSAPAGAQTPPPDIATARTRLATDTPSKLAQVKAKQGRTTDAAKDLLEKMQRRNRK
jgi:predicted component of type VI protein secretion system